MVEIAMRVTDCAGPSLLRCHNLEHEDLDDDRHRNGGGLNGKEN
jgi:hypothetical protein